MTTRDKLINRKLTLIELAEFLDGYMGTSVIFSYSIYFPKQRSNLLSLLDSY